MYIINLQKVFVQNDFTWLRFIIVVLNLNGLNSFELKERLCLHSKIVTIRDKSIK